MIPSETKIPDLDLTIIKELPAKFCLDISERDSPHGSKAGDDEVVVPGA